MANKYENVNEILKKIDYSIIDDELNNYFENLTEVEVIDFLKWIEFDLLSKWKINKQLNSQQTNIVANKFFAVHREQFNQKIDYLENWLKDKKINKPINLKSVKIPLSKNLTFTQYKNDYVLLLENYLKQYVDNTEQTFIKQQLFSFNEYLSFMVNGTMTKTKIQMLLEDLEQPKTLDDLKQSTEQKIEFLEDKLKEVSNNKAPQFFELKTETKDQKPRPKKIAEKWYALLYRFELEAKGKKPPTNREGQFIKSDIEAYREQTTKKSGQAFYREFIKIDLKNETDLYFKFNKNWQKTIIELSNNDQKIIDYLNKNFNK